ncbi:uncharacterized protein LOC141645971 [Silene latifolia]|uniref:uncharacterized protein LOC141645971 n=1 Tax=Silene latifolia TaxID=37657 RepID=UPI003D7826D6
MSFRGVTAGMKRQRPGSNAKELAPEEKSTFELIHSTGNMGIWLWSIKKELKSIPVDKCVKFLKGRGLIKEVPDVNATGRNKKKLMATEFEPSSDLTGGVWYQDGVFDTDMIESLRKVCKSLINRHKVMTADGILNAMKKSGALQFEMKIEQVKQILDTLCLENVIFKVKSNGLGEFVSFPFGSECYKPRLKQKKTGALASIPCGACTHINQCDPNGIVSPVTCEYYTKWLETLDF